MLSHSHSKKYRVLQQIVKILHSDLKIYLTSQPGSSEPMCYTNVRTDSIYVHVIQAQIIRLIYENTYF